MPKATWNNQVIAESNTYETVEGNIYFPKDSIKAEYFKPSETHTTCPWKGPSRAYYDVTVNGQTRTRTPRLVLSCAQGSRGQHQGPRGLLARREGGVAPSPVGWRTWAAFPGVLPQRLAGLRARTSLGEAREIAVQLGLGPGRVASLKQARGATIDRALAQLGGPRACRQHLLVDVKGFLAAARVAHFLGVAQLQVQQLPTLASVASTALSGERVAFGL